MSSSLGRKGVPTTPLSPFVDAFLGHCIDRNLSLATLDAYAQTLERFADFMQQHHPEVSSIAQVQVAHVQGFRRHLRQASAAAGRELSAGTQAKYLAAIRSLLRYYSVVQGQAVMLRDNIALPKLTRAGPPPRITRQDVQALLQQPDPRKPWGRRDRAIIALLVDTGLRVGELCALNRRDVRVDLLGKRPFLELSLPNAAVGLGQEAQRLLKEYLDARDDSYQPLFIRHKPGKAQHTDDAQHRLTRQMIDRMLMRYARAAGLTVLPSARDLASIAQAAPS